MFTSPNRQKNVKIVSNGSFNSNSSPQTKTKKNQSVNYNISANNSSTFKNSQTGSYLQSTQNKIATTSYFKGSHLSFGYQSQTQYTYDSQDKYSLQQNLSQQQIDYLKQQNVLDDLIGAVQQTAIDQPDDPLQSIIDIAKGYQSRTGQHSIQGQQVYCNPDVSVIIGPVVGEVTNNSAIIMLEAESKFEDEFDIEIIVVMYNQYQQTIKHRCKSKIPTSVLIKNLFAGTYYSIFIQGVDKSSAEQRIATFKTKDKKIKKFKFIVLSCDRPQRLLYGEKNPWDQLKKLGNKIDCCIHLGDQIYVVGDDIDDLHEDLANSKNQEHGHSQKQKKQIQAIFEEKYRWHYNTKSKKDVLSNCSNLMIWSDNDIANDFEINKNFDGCQQYTKCFVQGGVDAYRGYQRSLWDANFENQKDKDVEEWHSHQYDQIGVFLIDMKGNRTGKDGSQHSDNDFMSEKQVDDLKNFLSNTETRVVLIGSEIPFVGEPANEIQEKAKKKHTAFLKSHWPYRLHELVPLLELLFNWKLQGDREVIMLAGDIHCGVTSTIYDKATNQSILHLTTSPITNHVCKFFPKKEGEINSRFSYTHRELGSEFRNYAEIDIDLTNETRVDARLVPVINDN